MDIKLGNGAFMTELSEAKALAESIRPGCKTGGFDHEHTDYGYESTIGPRGGKCA